MLNLLLSWDSISAAGHGTPNRNDIWVYVTYPSIETPGTVLEVIIDRTVSVPLRVRMPGDHVSHLTRLSEWQDISPWLVVLKTTLLAPHLLEILLSHDS
jgi:hypothetical protein